MNIEQSLRAYYKDIFPLEKLFKLLEINEFREVSFYTNTNAYLRYLTFESIDAFRDKLLQVVPKKLDIGAIFDSRPAKSSNAKPVARELVFDIDLTDYPRTCCKDKNICKKCYEIIKCSVKLLDYILKVELGFKKYGFVFSGRRGVHCWIFEQKEMSGIIRNNIFKYFNLVVEKNLYVKEYADIMAEYGDADLVKNFFIRLDKSVTVSVNHLLKMPFSVHPDTLNISVPINPMDILELENVPTLVDVVENPSILQPFIDILDTWTR